MSTNTHNALQTGHSAKNTEMALLRNLAFLMLHFVSTCQELRILNTVTNKKLAGGLDISLFKKSFAGNRSNDL